MSSDEDNEISESNNESPPYKHCMTYDDEYDHKNNQKWNTFLNTRSIKNGGSVNNDKKSTHTPPLDILFPEDLEKLREELKVLRDEKSTLTKQLDESVEKCELLRIEIDVNNKFRNPVTGAQLATSKIVELSKKLREMTVELGASKLQCKQFEKMIKQFSALEEASRAGVDRSCGDTSTIADDQKKLKKQLENLQLKLFRTRSDGERLKTQLEIAYKVIEKEVGKEAEVVLKAFKDDNQTWIGRAEQIATLRQKVSELTEKLDSRKSCFVMNRNKVDALKAREKEMKIEYLKEIQDLKAQIEELKKSNVGAKARYNVLEGELKDERHKIKILTEKSNTDDEMIEILKKKVKINTSENFKKEELISALEKQLASIKEEMKLNKTKCDDLVRALAVRDEKIREQEDKLKTMNNEANGRLEYCSDQFHAFPQIMNSCMDHGNSLFTVEDRDSLMSDRK